MKEVEATKMNNLGNVSSIYMHTYVLQLNDIYEVLSTLFGKCKPN